MTTSPQAAPSGVESALSAALGTDAVITASGELDAYTADTYWPALAAKAAGTPLARPDVVVRPRTEEEVATVLEVAHERRIPVVPWGGGSGTQGGALAIYGGIVLDLRSLDQVIEIDEVSMTVTVQAGKNGRELEAELNARGLMLPHYPASVEWATVGGYIAARGSGVLSTRYGKIEDLLLSLRVATPAGGLVDTLPVPRHAMGPELTQLFVGSEGTLGIITRVTVKLVPLPAHRRFEAVALPTLESGIDALRWVMQHGIRPPVIRYYDAEASAGSLSPVVGQSLDGPTALLMFEGERAVADAEAETTLRALREARGTVLSPELCRTWWDHRYDFYHPPHYPTLPAMWGTIDAVASYGRILGVYHAIRAALEPFGDQGLRLRTHFSHWYDWGTMVYPRFLIGDTSELDDPPALYKAIWKAGVEAILDAGGVINDHHGVGSTLAPYLKRQWGPAHGTLARIKAALDPAAVMNPGKLGLARPGSRSG